MIETVSRSRPVSMADQWFDLAAIDHFWIEWRFEALQQRARILPSTGDPVMEVGCGHGVFRQQLEEQLGYTVDGCDLNVVALQMAKPGRGKLLIYDIHDRDPHLVGKYGAVFLMDVIEHIADDAAFLRSAAVHGRPGGLVVINVPAYQWLFSRYDTEAGHVRRYSRTSLRQLLKSAGLEPLEIHYWGFSLVPLLMARKAMLAMTGSGSIITRGFQPPGRAMHAGLKRLKKTELGLISSPVCGTSLLALARIPAQHTGRAQSPRDTLSSRTAGLHHA